MKSVYFKIEIQASLVVKNKKDLIEPTGCTC